MTEKGKKKEKKETHGRRAGRKTVVLLIILVAAAAAAGVILTKMMNDDRTVEFKILDEKQIPQDISSQVIPEYRSLERALACVIDDKVYVVVTRGEKPSSGYSVGIDRMTVREKQGRSTLIVYADFCDPQKGKALAQVLTYPVKVARTDLEKLPDEIEMRIQYEE